MTRLLRKQQLVGAVVMGAVALLAAAALVQAQTATPSATSTDAGTTTIRVAPIAQSPGNARAVPEALPAMVVNINGNGGALLRGIVVNATGTDAATTTGGMAITVASWGGTWTIRSSETTRVLPQSATNASGPAGNMSGIRIGDFVGVLGSVASGQSLAIDASMIRDWTRSAGVPAASGTTTTRSGVSLYTGTLSQTSDGSFTMTGTDGTAYTVNLSPNTIVWNNARQDLSFDEMQPGDSIRVNGTRNGTVINATVVRDISR